MSLANVKVSVPTTKDKIPSSNKPVTLRPFRVADEKSLLLAADSGDTGLMVQTLKDIIGNTVTGDFDVEKLASFDVEYLFLKLRAFSVGETSSLLFTCNECDHKNKVDVNVAEFEVKNVKSFNKTIKISDDLAFIMKPSDLEDLISVSEEPERFVDLIVKSVETVFYGEESYTITEADHEMLASIINELSSKQFENIAEYFVQYPKVSKDVEYDCKGCGKHREVKLEGLANFF